MAAPKIIVLGSLNGNLESPLKKLASLHAKNAFALALLTGDVFTPDTDDSVIDALLSGAYEIPLPTYFTVGQNPLPQRVAEKVKADEEICPNLHFLGRRSVTKTSEGIRIVSLGGVLDSSDSGSGGSNTGQHLPCYTEDDAKSLKGANSADILLTYAWPANVWAGSKVALDTAHKGSVVSNQSVSDLCTALKPRYHLTASPGPFFYEREPFIQAAHPGSDDVSVTRFISLAPYGNAAKQKAIYAFSLNRSDSTVPPGATASPFVSRKRRSGNSDGFENGHHYQRYDDSYERRPKRQRRQPLSPDQCYFCLSSPNLATHMCCSIGDDAYVTTAKGPLPAPTTFAAHGVDFPAHFIVIPLPHAPTTGSLLRAEAADTNDDDAAAAAAAEAARTQREMTRFRESLQSMLATRSDHALGAVTWEISRARNVHLIWQLVALPAGLIRRGDAEAAFRAEARNLGYPAFESRDFASVDEEAAAGDFFRLWLWADDDAADRIRCTTLVMPLPSDTRFDLQFGRRVLARLLGLESRVVWQDCAQTVDEETRDAEAFRKAFKKWDFTL